MTTGYSGTPLVKKLGIKNGTRVCAAGAPSNYRKLLHPLPDDVSIVPRVSEAVDVVHLFTRRQRDLTKFLAATLGRMRSDAAIWVSWPKKASKVPTDVTEDTIRAAALPLGLVDVKVCAVDDVWSGLKLVLRKEHR